jgi:hypothetical protein
MIVELTVDAPNADRVAADRRNDAHSELMTGPGDPPQPASVVSTS